MGGPGKIQNRYKSARQKIGEVGVEHNSGTIVALARYHWANGCRIKLVYNACCSVVCTCPTILWYEQRCACILYKCFSRTTPKTSPKTQAQTNPAKPPPVDPKLISRGSSPPTSPPFSSWIWARGGVAVGIPQSVGAKCCTSVQCEHTNAKNVCTQMQTPIHVKIKIQIQYKTGVKRKYK